MQVSFSQRQRYFSDGIIDKCQQTELLAQIFHDHDKEFVWNA